MQAFEKTSVDGETKAEWYLRQMLGSWNTVFRLSLPNDFGRKATSAVLPETLSRKIFGGAVPDAIAA